MTIRFIFLDVAQGDSSVILLPDDRAVVVDCPSGKAEFVLDFLESHRVRTLELVLVTHSDFDHFGGISRLVRNFRGCVNRLWFRADRPHPTPEYKRQVQDLMRHVKRDRSETEPSEPTRGGFCRIEPIDIRVLHPDVATHALAAVGALDRNDAGVVISVSFGEHSVLFGADVQGVGWEDIASCCNLSADILHVPHHGDSYEGGMTLAELVARVQPTYGIISAGRNGHGHPEPATVLALVQAGVKVFCTQATVRCHPDPLTIRQDVMQILGATSDPGAVGVSRNGCPCAGTVEFELPPTGAPVLCPSIEQHERVLQIMEHAMCLGKGPNRYLAVSGLPSRTQ